MKTTRTLSTDEVCLIIREHLIKEYKMSENEWISEILVKRDFGSGKLNFTFTMEDL